MVVIGGGIAGMAAAWYLRKAGVDVTLIEARPSLGGRLASHIAPGCPTPFDNGPHLFLSSYTHARRLFKELGLADAFEYPYPGAIPYEGANGQRGTLREWPLPAPLNLTAGLLAFPLLSPGARIRVCRSASKLWKNVTVSAKDAGARHASPLPSAAEWLKNQSEDEERIIFWEPLIRAAMNTPAEVVPASYLQVVLKEGFCKGVFGGRLGYAKEPLGKIFGDRAREALETAGVKVLLKTAAYGTDIREGKIAGIRLKSGQTLPCDAAIAALPPWALAEWLKGVPGGDRIRAEYMLDAWQANPIATLYLWADNRPLLEPYICLPGRQAGWVFDFARLWGDRKAPLAVMAEQEAAFAEVLAAIPQLRQVRWTAWKAVSEKRATPLRPRELWGKALPQETVIPNLFLAGDWLDPDLPPTVEAAVREGKRIRIPNLQ